MAREREYELHVIFGAPSVLPWKWPVWKQVASALAPTIASSDGKPATYSRQYERIGKRLRDVTFGRMTWGNNTHERWTHDSPETSGKSGSWEFVDTQVWVPGRAICERERKRPNIYFQVLNGGLGGGEDQSLKFGSVVALGIARDQPETARFQVELTATKISELLDARLRVFKTRPWSLPFGLYVIDSMNDLDTWLFRTGPRHTEEPTLALLKEDWQLRPLGDAKSILGVPGV